MPLTQYSTATSLDGFIADENDSLDWLFAVATTGNEDRFAPFLADVGAFAMGATTYRWVLRVEHVLDAPEKWQDWYGDRPCWVFSHHELPEIPGADIEFVQGDVRPVHAAMAAAAGNKNIWLVGGGNLVGQFVDAGLLDEVILGYAPVTLGAGASVLPRRMTDVLELQEAVVVNGAFVEVRYRVKPSRGAL
jgi:dihydrofolate reductase